VTHENRIAVDTSVAILLLVASHEAHAAVSSWAHSLTLGLGGHALTETYSVLTRLPGDARLSPADAVRLIDDNFVADLSLPSALAASAHRELARQRVAGGATYDGLVALAAREHGVPLATRDARARPTYDAIGVQVIVVPS
jgi:predicted nucleic acid-binding protein